MSTFIAYRTTFDGIGVSLVETGDEREPLAIWTGEPRTLTMRRKPLLARAVLALWGDITILTIDEARAADRRLASVDAGGDYRVAIHPPAKRTSKPRRTAESLVEHVKRGCRALHCRTCGLRA